MKTEIISTNVKWAASWQNQKSGMCAQRKLRSAWAPAQSDQSLCCPHEETLDPQLPTHRAHCEDSDQTGRMPRLIWVSAGRTCHFVGFVIRRLKYTTRNLLSTSHCKFPYQNIRKVVEVLEGFQYTTWNWKDTILNENPSSPIIWPSFKPLVQIVFEISRWQV